MIQSILKLINGQLFDIGNVRNIYQIDNEIYFQYENTLNYTTFPNYAAACLAMEDIKTKYEAAQTSF